MGWGNKAIEIRSVESGHLDGVFMHKKVREYVKKHFAIEGLGKPLKINPPLIARPLRGGGG